MSLYRTTLNTSATQRARVEKPFLGRNQLGVELQWLESFRDPSCIELVFSVDSDVEEAAKPAVLVNIAHIPHWQLWVPFTAIESFRRLRIPYRMATTAEK